MVIMMSEAQKRAVAKYSAKRQTKKIALDLYMDDEQEKWIFDNLEKLKKDKKFKSVFVEIFSEYFTRIVK